MRELASAPAEDVTVATIVRHARVSRSAFYLQFNGLEDLLIAMIQQTAMQLGPPADERLGTSATRRERARAALTRLVRDVDMHASFYMAATSWKVTLRVHNATVEAYAEQIHELISAAQGSAANDRSLPRDPDTERIAIFVAGGLTAAITDWLRSGLKPSPDALVEHLLTLLPAWLVSEESPAVAAESATD